jgi:ketosteroid isomerase-like protein
VVGEAAPSAAAVNTDRARSAIEVVTRLIAAIGDDRREAVLALVDPNVVWRPVSRPGQSVYHGHAGMLRFMSDLRTAYGRFRIEVEYIMATSATEVVSRARPIRETPSGDQPGQPIVSVYTIREGRVICLESELAEPQ